MYHNTGVVIDNIFGKNNRNITTCLQETHLLLRRGGLGHVGAAGPEEQNKEVGVCRQQKHQMLGGWGRIHLDSRSAVL